MPNSDLSRSHRTLARRYYYSLGLVLFLSGVVVMLLPHVLHREGELWKSLGEVGSFLALIVALHFLYELMVKRHELELLVDDVETIVGRQMEELNRALLLGRAVNYSGVEDAYTAVAAAIARTSSRQSGEKSLLLVALHGHSGKRRAVRPNSDLVHAKFSEEIYKCIMSSGPDKWYVRELYNVVDEARLEMILGRIEKAGDAEGYEIRAFCLQNVLPQLAPMVVGNDDLFMGLDDPTYYGVKAAFHIRGSSFVQTATEYFESLWNDKRAHVLRSGFGAETANIDSLRNSIRDLQNEE